MSSKVRASGASEASALTFVQEKEKSPLFVNNTSHNEIRIAMDDLVCEWLNSDGGFRQSFQKSNLLIVVQLLGILLGSMAFLISYKIPFDEGKAYIFFLVMLYFGIQGGYWLFSQFVDSHELYKGSKGNKTILVMTEMKAPSTSYRICVSDGTRTPSKDLACLEQGVETWLDVKGQLDARIFARDMAALFNKL